MSRVKLRANSAFSYLCGRCQSCCHDRRVYLNPFELARLARAKKVSTSKVIATYVEQSRFSLRHQQSGACVFLSESGCEVYQDRPLACRLYPLARRKSKSKETVFAELTPEPNTKGTYGQNGTVAEYLSAQETAVFEKYADQYFELFSAYLATQPPSETAAEMIREIGNEHLPIQQRLLLNAKLREKVQILFDIDGSLNCRDDKQTVEQKTDEHLKLLAKILAVE